MRRARNLRCFKTAKRISSAPKKMSPETAPHEQIVHSLVLRPEDDFPLCLIAALLLEPGQATHSTGLRKERETTFARLALQRRHRL